MEIVEGKPTDKKVIVAQEIAFAKVLAGNNKTLRDRAVKKLKKWLTVRGNGKWVFTEEEFIRIWTGLFYCMWMSDKFLVQEELAENISHLIHCFKNNSNNALLFFKSFNKRLLMEYEGLDQYRIDKFNMLIRRFLRQTLMYCKEISWNESFVRKVMNIISDVVFHKDSALGLVLHFVNIYLEEVAKVSQGKLDNKTVLLLIEPFVKLLARSKDERLQIAAVEFFNDLMRQTDAGIEFEEKFKVWKKLGFPGTSVNCIQKQPRMNASENEFSSEESEEENDDDDDDNDNDFDKPLDPRAGSVHVELSQIPVDISALINLFKKHELKKQTTPKSRKKIRALIQKFSVLNKGRFPLKIKKDPIIDEKIKNPRLTIKNAKNLLKFTEEIESGPIKSKEFARISKQLNAKNKNTDNIGNQKKKINADDNSDLDSGTEAEEDSNYVENESDEVDEKGDEITEKLTKPKKKLKKPKGGKKEAQQNDIKKNKVTKTPKKINNKKETEKANIENAKGKLQKSSKKKKKRSKKKEILLNGVNGVVKNDEKIIQVPKIRKSLNGEATPVEKKQFNGGFEEETIAEKESLNSSSKKKNGVKRKILSDWVVQDIEETSPEYNRIKPQKVIKLEVKFDRSSDSEENQEPDKLKNSLENIESDNEIKKTGKVFTPVFWEKAKAKVLKKKKSSNVFMNPFAGGDNDSNFRRISFALEKNMAQENEEYLEEVRNSPKVPFDGSKKPVQSALKSGLSPSPINPFYRIKKIKF